VKDKDEISRSTWDRFSNKSFWTRIIAVFPGRPDVSLRLRFGRAF